MNYSFFINKMGVFIWYVFLSLHFMYVFNPNFEFMDELNICKFNNWAYISKLHVLSEFYLAYKIEKYIHIKGIICTICISQLFIHFNMLLLAGLLWVITALRIIIKKKTRAEWWCLAYLIFIDNPACYMSSIKVSC